MKFNSVHFNDFIWDLKNFDHLLFEPEQVREHPNRTRTEPEHALKVRYRTRTRTTFLNWFGFGFSSNFEPNPNSTLSSVRFGFVEALLIMPLLIVELLSA